VACLPNAVTIIHAMVVAAAAGRDGGCGSLRQRQRTPSGYLAAGPHHGGAT